MQIPAPILSQHTALREPSGTTHLPAPQLWSCSNTHIHLFTSWRLNLHVTAYVLLSICWAVTFYPFWFGSITNINARCVLIISAQLQWNCLTPGVKNAAWQKKKKINAHIKQLISILKACMRLQILSQNRHSFFSLFFPIASSVQTEGSATCSPGDVPFQWPCQDSDKSLRTICISASIFLFSLQPIGSSRGQ